jgi:hypothetical protein
MPVAPIKMQEQRAAAEEAMRLQQMQQQLRGQTLQAPPTGGPMMMAPPNGQPPRGATQNFGVQSPQRQYTQNPFSSQGGNPGIPTPPSGPGIQSMPPQGMGPPPQGVPPPQGAPAPSPGGPAPGGPSRPVMMGGGGATNQQQMIRAVRGRGGM